MRYDRCEVWLTFARCQIDEMIEPLLPQKRGTLSQAAIHGTEEMKSAAQLTGQPAPSAGHHIVNHIFYAESNQEFGTLRGTGQRIPHRA